MRFVRCSLLHCNLSSFNHSARPGTHIFQVRAYHADIKSIVHHMLGKMMLALRSKKTMFMKYDRISGWVVLSVFFLLSAKKRVFHAMLQRRGKRLSGREKNDIQMTKQYKESSVHYQQQKSTPTLAQ